MGGGLGGLNLSRVMASCKTEPSLDPAFLWVRGVSVKNGDTSNPILELAAVRE